MGTFGTAVLPAHARIIASSDVWMEGDGVLQFAKTAGLAGCVAAAGMPDLHVGKGPVGAVFATSERVYPHLLGGDVGCGVTVVATGIEGQSRDAIERWVRKSWDDNPVDECDADRLFRAAFGRGLAGVSAMEEVPERLRAVAARVCEAVGAGASGEADSRVDSAVAGEVDEEAMTPYLDGEHGAALGTVGGGNHFVEIARVDEVADREAASRLGLARGRLVVVAHSGSRGLGTALAHRWGQATLTGEAIGRYVREVTGACRFAQVNRFLLAARMLRALGAGRASEIRNAFEVTHNDVREETVNSGLAWVHRKGAAPAHEGQATVVLGSRGAPSWVLIGTGSEHGLRSVAHGAGRRMGRAEALSKLKAKYKRSELQTTKLGGRVVCDDPALLYEEHPDAYKPVEPVVASLIDAGLARAVASLVPVVTVKR